jgi:hypothetical protein
MSKIAFTNHAFYIQHSQDLLFKNSETCLSTSTELEPKMLIDRICAAFFIVLAISSARAEMSFWMDKQRIVFEEK